MKKLAVILSFLLLCSCAGKSLPTITIQNPISITSLQTIEDAYGAALAIAVTYRRSCIARLIPKNCFVTIEAIKPYENKAYNALKIAQSFIRDNPTLDPTSVINIAQLAIQAFTDQQILRGIK